MSVANEVGELFAVALFLEIAGVEMIKRARMSATISAEATTTSNAHIRQNVRQKLNKKYSFFSGRHDGRSYRFERYPNRTFK